jgi:hypothetical protein
MKRNEGESFEDYKKRRKEENLYMKHRLKGIMFHRSREMQVVENHDKLREDGTPTPEIKFVGVTYRKPK